MRIASREYGLSDIKMDDASPTRQDPRRIRAVIRGLVLLESHICKSAIACYMRARLNLCAVPKLAYT